MNRCGNDLKWMEKGDGTDATGDEPLKTFCSDGGDSNEQNDGFGECGLE